MVTQNLATLPFTRLSAKTHVQPMDNNTKCTIFKRLIFRILDFFGKVPIAQCLYCKKLNSAHAASNRIRQIRKAHGFTQAEIAYACDISPSAYGQIERRANNATFGTLQKVAAAIGVSLPFLIDINSDQYIEKNKL